MIILNSLCIKQYYITACARSRLPLLELYVVYLAYILISNKPSKI